MPQLGPPLAQVDHAGSSWMLDEAKKTKELLYVSDAYTRHVYVYNYKTGALLGRLHGFFQPSGQCVDGNGDIWIADYAGESIVEYAHGGIKPIKSMRTTGQPDGCSVDPTTGNLAVSNFTTPSGGSDIEVFAASGKTDYSSQDCYDNLYEPGYDKQGNLLVEGTNPSDLATNICELPHGGNALETLSLNQSIHQPAGVMWDGKYITLTDVNYDSATAVVQVQQTGSDLTVVNATILDNTCGPYNIVFQPFIIGKQNTPKNAEQGSVVVGPNAECENDFLYWAYPTGGSPTKTLFGSPRAPAGQSVSIATK